MIDWITKHLDSFPIMCQNPNSTGIFNITFTFCNFVLYAWSHPNLISADSFGSYVQSDV